MRIKAEGNTLTLKIYNNIRSKSWWDEDDDKAEDAVANVEDLDRILKDNKNAYVQDSRNGAFLCSLIFCFCANQRWRHISRYAQADSEESGCFSC